MRPVTLPAAGLHRETPRPLSQLPLSRNDTEDESALLLARVARQDVEALRALYEALAAQALALAQRMLGNRVEAEDVLQDVFVDVWQRSGSFDPSRGSGRTWLLSIVRNRALDRLRRRAVAARALDRVGAEDDRLPMLDAGPGEALERSQERQRVATVLSGLSEAQQEALRLAYYEGLTQSEIAARIKEPLGTVKTRMRAALEKLARLMSSHGVAS